MDLDLVEKGLGIRSRRYAMLVDNGTVTDLNLEEGGAPCFVICERPHCLCIQANAYPHLSLDLPTYKLLLFLICCRRLHSIFCRGDSERPIV